MSGSDHQRAGRLIDQLAIEGLHAADREWLDSHLAACPQCAQLQLSTGRTLGALRGVSPMPAPAIVAATRRNVHVRALELQRRAAIHRPVWAACVLSWLWMLLTTPYFWRAFAWLGGMLGLPGPVWQSAFLLAWSFPATIVAAVVVWKQLYRPVDFAGEAESEMHRP